MKLKNNNSRAYIHVLSFLFYFEGGPRKGKGKGEKVK